MAASPLYGLSIIDRAAIRYFLSRLLALGVRSKISQTVGRRHD
jgi:hypothetical protein